MDIFNPQTRSYIMSRIKGKNTQPEMVVRKFLFAHGFRYRVHVKRLPGTPDIVLKKYRTVIFIHGCFWHGHENCKLSSMPKSNVEFWSNKIFNNRLRDNRVREQLKEMGWNTMVVWECQLKKGIVREKTLNDVLALLDDVLLKSYSKHCDPAKYIAMTDEKPLLAAEQNNAYYFQKNHSEDSGNKP